MDTAGSGFIANPQLDEALQQQLKEMQSLPPPQAQDVERFQDVFKGIADGSSVSPSDQNTPILQLMGEEKAEQSGLKEALINQLSTMDTSYHSVMDQLVNKPSFSDYLDRSLGGDRGDDIRTYPSVSEEASGSDDFQNRSDALINDIQNTQQVAIEYQRDMSSWFMNAQMWATGVNVISSAAKQVSTAFQTLFRASG